MVRMILRPRHYFWLFFGGLFIWAALFYRNQKKAKALRHSFKPKTNVTSDIKEEPFVMVGNVRVGKEWVQIASDVNLPAGLDIEVDMQTGLRRVRLHEPENSKSPAPVEVSDSPGLVEDGEISPMPQRKWQRIYEAKHKTIIDSMLE